MESNLPAFGQGIAPQPGDCAGAGEWEFVCGEVRVAAPSWRS